MVLLCFVEQYGRASSIGDSGSPHYVANLMHPVKAAKRLFDDFGGFLLSDRSAYAA